MSPIRSILALSPVIPVMVIDNPAHAVPLAQALVDGGIFALEITLRTPAALEAIAAIRTHVPEAVVGAGTVLTPTQWHDSMAAGAQFGVSPGLTAPLLEAIGQYDTPFLPGVATASEVMNALAAGLTTCKLFPAEAIGGIALLQAFAGPFAPMAFCPTGGIGAHNAAAYLALPNVLAVGGSWLTPRDRIAAQDWGGITRLAQAAADLQPRNT